MMSESTGVNASNCTLPPTYHLCPKRMQAGAVTVYLHTLDQTHGKRGGQCSNDTG